MNKYKTVTRSQRFKIENKEQEATAYLILSKDGDCDFLSNCNNCPLNLAIYNACYTENKEERVKILEEMGVRK